ncbi:MAG TPA: GtrA family protein [Dermatophilaceae bacterium]|nr:GtrA family protein [Dermatophilaceae bacterium]
MPVSLPSAPTERPTLRDRLYGALDVLVREMLKFGVVGAVAFVVDIGLFNLLRFAGGEGPMYDKPIRAKIVSVAVATLTAWLGNRYWTFRHRRRAAAHHELLLFVVFNVAGMAIALVCLATSHYLLNLRSPLADNVSANGVGLVLGTLFRFWAYRTFVFKGDALAGDNQLSDDHA